MLSSAEFYSSQILASLVLVVGLNLINGPRLMTNLIIGCTSIFAVFTLFTQIGYVQENYVLYDVYPLVSDVINATEFGVLLTGTAIRLAHGDNNRMGVTNPFRHIFHISSLVHIREDSEWKG